MSTLQKFKRPDLSEEILFWIDHNLKNYLEDNDENYSEIEHIIDYLLSENAPKRLKKMSYDEAKTASDLWMKSLIKKGNNIVETEADLKTVIDFQDGYKLVKLLTKSAYEREGNLMSHCVASYFDKKDIYIYSLRDELNVPHCTIELQKGEYVNQIKGKGNGSIHPKYVKYIIQSLQKLGNKINSNDLVNLGYIQLSSETWKLLEKKYTKIPFINFNGDKFLYAYGKLK